MRKAVKEFEGYFIAYLLKEMRNTVHPGLVPNKEGQQFYSFYDQEIGRLAAQSGGLGLGRMLEQALAPGPRPSPQASNPDPTQVFAPFRR
jgi:Rod binding domain-containing protein